MSKPLRALDADVFYNYDGAATPKAVEIEGSTLAATTTSTKTEGQLTQDTDNNVFVGSAQAGGPATGELVFVIYEVSPPANSTNRTIQVAPAGIDTVWSVGNRSVSYGDRNNKWTNGTPDLALTSVAGSGAYFNEVDSTVQLGAGLWAVDLQRNIAINAVYSSDHVWLEDVDSGAVLFGVTQPAGFGTSAGGCHVQGLGVLEGPVQFRLKTTNVVSGSPTSFPNVLVSCRRLQAS
jgi:hypothetical protein